MGITKPKLLIIFIIFQVLVILLVCAEVHITNLLDAQSDEIKKDFDCNFYPHDMQLQWL